MNESHHIKTPLLGFYTKVVITWGDENSGGDSLDVWDEVSAGVVDLCHTSGAFAARKANGSVVSCAQLLESPQEKKWNFPTVPAQMCVCVCKV